MMPLNSDDRVKANRFLPTFIPGNSFPSTNWIIQSTDAKERNTDISHKLRTARMSIVCISCLQERLDVLLVKWKEMIYKQRIPRNMQRILYLEFGYKSGGVVVKLSNRT